MFYRKFTRGLSEKVYFAYRFYWYTLMNNVDFTIYREGPTKYKIDFSVYSEPLIKSIVHSRQIDDISVYKDYRTIEFTATSVQTYTEFRDGLLYEMNGAKRLSYEATLRLMSSLATQLKYLIEKQSSCFYLLNSDNLVVIDGNKFVYMSNQDLTKLMPDGKTMFIIQPFTCRTNFVSPELRRIMCIPAKVDYRSIYYSLGALALYCLSGNECLSGNFDKHDAVLGELKGTKLYAMLQRCLAEDPCERSILFV